MVADMPDTHLTRWGSERREAEHLHSLAVRMRRVIDIKDRWSRNKVHLDSSCFLGSSAIDWLVGTGEAESDGDAEKIGTAMVAQGLIHELHGNHAFGRPYHYRFAEDDFLMAVTDPMQRLRCLAKMSHGLHYSTLWDICSQMREFIGCDCKVQPSFAGKEAARFLREHVATPEVITDENATPVPVQWDLEVSRGKRASSYWGAGKKQPQLGKRGVGEGNTGTWKDDVIDLGNQMIRTGLFHHTGRKRGFEDGDTLYCFPGVGESKIVGSASLYTSSLASKAGRSVSRLAWDSNGVSDGGNRGSSSSSRGSRRNYPLHYLLRASWSGSSSSWGTAPALDGSKGGAGRGGLIQKRHQRPATATAGRFLGLHPAAAAVAARSSSKSVESWGRHEGGEEGNNKGRLIRGFRRVSDGGVVISSSGNKDGDGAEENRPQRSGAGIRPASQEVDDTEPLRSNAPSSSLHSFWKTHMKSKSSPPTPMLEMERRLVGEEQRTEDIEERSHDEWCLDWPSSSVVGDQGGSDACSQQGSERTQGSLEASTLAEEGCDHDGGEGSSTSRESSSSRSSRPKIIGGGVANRNSNWMKASTSSIWSDGHPDLPGEATVLGEVVDIEGGDRLTDVTNEVINNSVRIVPPQGCNDSGDSDPFANTSGAKAIHQHVQSNSGIGTQSQSGSDAVIRTKDNVGRRPSLSRVSKLWPSQASVSLSLSVSMEGGGKCYGEGKSAGDGAVEDSEGEEGQLKSVSLDPITSEEFYASGGEFAIMVEGICSSFPSPPKRMNGEFVESGKQEGARSRVESTVLVDIEQSLCSCGLINDTAATEAGGSNRETLSWVRNGGIKLS